MTLADMQPNRQYEISKINTNDSILLERFISLGLCEGANASLLEKSLDKSTIAIILNNTRIALRVSEAQVIVIKEI